MQEEKKQIHIQVKDKIATFVSMNFTLVGGNSDYEVVFDFDSEWAKYPVKTALFVYADETKKVVIDGNTCKGIPIEKATICLIGAFAGDIYTTTPACIRDIKLSIRDVATSLPEPPTEDVYNQIMELLNRYINEASGIPSGGSKGQVLKKASDNDFDATWQDDEKGTQISEEDILRVVKEYIEQNPPQDGFSPTVNIIPVDNGYTVNITDKNDVHSYTLYNGLNGIDGISATHSWNGTILTVSSASGTSSADLKGEKGEKGERGEQGVQGLQGVQGIQGIQGVQGEKGDKGDGFSISKTYISVAAMNAGFYTDDVPLNGFVLINTGNVNDVDNAKLFVKTLTGYSYLTDLSGSQGIKGDKGDKGDQGIQGEQGIRGEQGIQGIQGEKGADGINGKDGNTPYIQDGYWYIDGVNTNVKAEGKDGVNGETPLKGTDYWTPTDKKEIISEVNDNIAETLENLETLPYGGSKEWLEANGDITQLYQIDGYVWGYIESDGWTRSNRQFLVVSSESEMTNEEGTEYLLRSGDEGTVYEYCEASGDVNVPVCDSLPETANGGDIVAVGGRKYQYTAYTAEELAYTNLATPDANASGEATWNTGGWCNNSYMAGSTYAYRAATDGRITTNKFAVVKGGIIYVKGITYSEGATLQIATFDANGNYIKHASAYNMDVNQGNINNLTKISEDYWCFDNSKAGEVDNNARFIRIAGVPSGSITDIAIAQNQEITTKPVTKFKWVDIGEYTIIDAGWKATEETYSVIDSLSATANSGDSAVYSVDGYVYAYIAGSDWMQMSKYTPQTVDKQLSDTSSNAVQNKVVTEAINKVKSDIINLEDRVDAGGSGGTSEAVTIPSYWENAANTAVERIKTRQNLAGHNCVDFIMFSDMHIIYGQNDNAHNVGKLSRYFMDKCDIPLACMLGDWTNSAGESTKEFALEDVRIAKEILSPIPNDALCTILGNHDLYFSTTGESANSVTVEERYNELCRHMIKDYRKVFDEDGTYYYVDNIPQKTRFIFLNSNWAKWTVNSNDVPSYSVFSHGGYGQKQLEFLANSLKVDNDWSVCLFTHVPPLLDAYPTYFRDVDILMGIINAYADKTTYTGTYTGSYDWDSVNISVDYSTESGNLVAMFAGHRHLDEIFTNVLRCPIVTVTTCSGQKLKDGYARTYGTDTETALDVVTINKNTRTIYCTRVGVGSDREIGY